MGSSNGTKNLLDPYRYKIVTGDIDKVEVLESASRISKAADIWASCIKILKRNNWNSFVYLKKAKKGGAGCSLDDFKKNEHFEETEVELDLLKATVSTQINRFKGNT